MLCEKYQQFFDAILLKNNIVIFNLEVNLYELLPFDQSRQEFDFLKT